MLPKCFVVQSKRQSIENSLEELLQVKEAIEKKSIVGCCNHIDLIFEKCLSEYDIETALFYGNIRFMEKASLTDTLTAELKTDSNLYLEYISSKLFVKFISDLKAVQEGFRDRAQLCSNSCLEEFDANFAGKLEELGEKLVEKVVSSVREGNSLTWPSIRKMVQKAVKEDLPRCSAELVAIGIEKENLNAKLLNLKAYFSEVVDHQTLQMLSVLAAVRLDNVKDNIEETLLKALISKNNRVEFKFTHLLTANNWKGMKENLVALSYLTEVVF
ncbi:hypothetical protein M9H77_15351 [Catharanthus roseus]|uniref:Uncharacterized protein n=1 Tax=Catharanthus roseus TaxID=4058 RepID=A0ACC0B0T3_CATRO|nr:hypothetical protein M9H77_15351 [Catharanthus roseus]